MSSGYNPISHEPLKKPRLMDTIETCPAMNNFYMNPYPLEAPIMPMGPLPMAPRPPNFDGPMDDDQEFILFVYNIGADAVEDDLGQLFSSYGFVKRVNVIRKDGVGRGFGFVTMNSYHEAVNAINALNGYPMFGNNPLQVSFKK